MKRIELFSANILTKKELKDIVGGQYITCSITYKDSFLGWRTTSFSVESSSPAQAAGDIKTSYIKSSGSCTQYGTNNKFSF